MKKSFDFLKKYFPLILFILLCLTMFISFVKADTNNYFDLPQVSVDELPTASFDTLNKVYIVDNKYYITEEISTGGSPSYLPLNENLKGVKIFVNGANDNLYNICLTDTQSGSYKRWVRATGTLGGSNDSNLGDNEYVPYMTRGNCGTPGRIGSGTYKRNTGVETSCTGGCNNYDTSFYAVGGSYLEYFILDTDFYINTIRNEDYYHQFSTTPFTSTTTYSWLEVTESQVFRVKPYKLFVPTDSLYCYHFISDNVIRGYEEQPSLNTTIGYYDFNIDRHYNYTTGNEEITDLPVCLSNITTNYLYREDIVQVLIFAFLVGFIVIFIPIWLILRLFKRRI